MRGVLAYDSNDHWGHNKRLGSTAGYLVCDGYIGGPLLASDPLAASTFANNCALTAPPGVPGIMDAPENHSTANQGYPAYTVASPSGEGSFFLCDGFLNSTAWCSLKAHQEARKISRSAEARNWERVSNPAPRLSAETGRPVLANTENRQSPTRPIQNVSSSPQGAQRIEIVLSAETRSFIRDTVSQAVNKAVDKRFP